MAKLNHTIVASRDKKKSALFFSEILGLDAPSMLGPFALVSVGDELTLDFIEADAQIVPQHYAFLVTEAEFDEIFGRIQEQGLTYWSDPGRRNAGTINRWDDGRGVYFDDLDGHLLEILTRPYGSAGTSAKHPHPLVMKTLAREASRDEADAGRAGGSVLANHEHPGSPKSG